MTTYGAEIEKPISNISTGLPHGLSQACFGLLKDAAALREVPATEHRSDIDPHILIGINSKDLGEQGLDNAFNLQETALPYQTSLGELQILMKKDLATVQNALQDEGATVINLSIHPLCNRNEENYRAFVAPKGIYKYILHRGWDHSAGIDARAQNSPATGVSPNNAASAVSAIIGAGAAFVGLYANSPYEEGKRSSAKESRLNLWDRMMGSSTVIGDWDTAKFPPDRLNTLADYFNWMFGGRTGIHFVIDTSNGNRGYKSVGDQLLIVKGNPSVLNYLSKNEWEASYLNDIKQNTSSHSPKIVRPSIDHMSAMQFAQFTGARIRYGLRNENFPLKEFLEGCKKPDGKTVERLFDQFATYIYIEGRDPGANFPDREILDKYGQSVAETVEISPSAIQAGIIGNLDEVTRYLGGYDWKQLGILRDQAIKNGLQGEAGDVSVYSFARDIVELAGRGLSGSQHYLLSYPLAVLREKANGADRAIKFVEEDNHTLVDLVKNRQVSAIK